VRAALPAPLPVPWTMKPADSAESGLDTLDDGRLRLWIRHDLLHGVTPGMLVWWFQHLEGEMEVQGVRAARYRFWHPLDHVAFHYVRRAPGPVGPGAVFGIHEVLGRDPAFEVNLQAFVTRLDEGGLAQQPRIAGTRRIVRLDDTFERVLGGTRYVNSMTVGIAGAGAAAPAARLFNAWLRSREFSDARGRAWLKHSIEEVGNFEFFLPRLVATDG
jgi:hypothetical protein